MTNTLENSIVTSPMEIGFFGVKFPHKKYKAKPTDGLIKSIKLLVDESNEENMKDVETLLEVAPLKEARPNKTRKGFLNLTFKTNAFFTDEEGNERENFVTVFDENLEKIAQEDIPNFGEGTTGIARVWYTPATLNQGEYKGKTTAYLTAIQLLSVEGAVTPEELEAKRAIASEENLNILRAKIKESST